MNTSTVVERLLLDANVGRRRLYQVTFQTPDRPVEKFGPSKISVVARSQIEAIVRAGLDLDDAGVREWSLDCVEVAS